MTENLRSWGVAWNPDMYRSVDFDCKCGFQLPFNLQSRSSLLVGFDISVPHTAFGSLDRVGGGIFQCQECWEYFWFHFTETTANFFMRHAPQWPK